eukprot:1600114-Amphidinium_carterae.1
MVFICWVALRLPLHKVDKLINDGHDVSCLGMCAQFSREHCGCDHLRKAIYFLTLLVTNYASPCAESNNSF